MAPRLWKLPEWQAVGAARGKPGRSRRRPGGRATPPWVDRPRPEAALSRAAAARAEGPRQPRARCRRLAGLPPQDPRSRGPRAMQRLAMDLRMLSRELSHYLEHQVRVGFFGSGVGFSLILGFSVAYACYYLSSIAKVSRGMPRAPWRRAAGSFAGSDNSRRSRRCRCKPRASGRGRPGGPFPRHLMDALRERGTLLTSARVALPGHLSLTRRSCPRDALLTFFRVTPGRQLSPFPRGI